MKTLSLLVLFFWSVQAQAQTSSVLPSELTLQVELEPTEHIPLSREMVLITIKGVYRRHITREQLIQPDLKGFNWTQLGDDTWTDARIDGEKVKVFSRRMAVFPDRPGKMTIGAFTHRLTLTDEQDEWFEHRISSEPVTFHVEPAPAHTGWWFPVKSLKISDQWSNEPDQLKPGEGVLRVVRIEAMGVTPEMIPPMPVLQSPSAMIFPHPEKRFVELSPQGPVSYAYWRWTIRPGNDTSAIVEPLSFAYFDTRNRVNQTATISAQRVAYGAVVPDQSAGATVLDAPVQTRLPGLALMFLAGCIWFAGTYYALLGWQLTGRKALYQFPVLDPMVRQMRRAARAGQHDLVRRCAVSLMRRDGPSTKRQELLTQLDYALFGKREPGGSLLDFTRAFVKQS